MSNLRKFQSRRLWIEIPASNSVGIMPSAITWSYFQVHACQQKHVSLSQNRVPPHFPMPHHHVPDANTPFLDTHRLFLFQGFNVFQPFEPHEAKLLITLGRSGGSTLESNSIHTKRQKSWDFVDADNPKICCQRPYSYDDQSFPKTLMSEYVLKILLWWPTVVDCWAKRKTSEVSREESQWGFALRFLWDAPRASPPDQAGPHQSHFDGYSSQPSRRPCDGLATWAKTRKPMELSLDKASSWTKCEESWHCLLSLWYLLENLTKWLWLKLIDHHEIHPKKITCAGPSVSCVDPALCISSFTKGLLASLWARGPTTVPLAVAPSDVLLPDVSDRSNAKGMEAEPPRRRPTSLKQLLPGLNHCAIVNLNVLNWISGLWPWDILAIQTSGMGFRSLNTYPAY